MLQHQSAPAHVISIGPFGKAIARCLRELRDDVEETPVDNDTLPLPGLWPSSRVTIVTAWRPTPNVCALVEELSFQWGRPFVPVIADATTLRFGPIVIPGQGACWSCWSRRAQQHAVWQETRPAVLEFYAAHPESGPQGFLEPFAVLAAARTSQILDDLDRARSIGGSIWEIDTITRAINASTLIGIHGCSRCGLQRPESSRSFSSLQEDLAYIWASEAGSGR